MDTIEVLYVFNDAYAEMGCVSMTSLVCNTKRKCRIHVFENGLSEKEKQKVGTLAYLFPNCQIVFYHVDDSACLNFNTGGWQKVFTWYRVLAPEILSGLNKVIYLDADTVVVDDIGQLWDTDLGKCFAAVARHRLCIPDENNILGVREGFYFNAGVLMLNLAKIRETNLFASVGRCDEELKIKYDMAGRQYMNDQAALNCLFNNNVVIVPPKFNLTSTAPYDINHDFAALKEWADAFKKPVVIHYLSRKPPSILSKNLQNFMWEKYFEYKARSPYADTENDNRAIAEYRQYEEKIRDSLLLRELFLEAKLYDEIMDTAKRLPDMTGGRKLALWGMGEYIRVLIAVLASRGINVETIVDGVGAKWGSKVFGYEVQNPDILTGKKEEFFVLISIMKPRPIGSIASQLERYGYGKEDYHHAYSTVWQLGELYSKVASGKI